MLGHLLTCACVCVVCVRVCVVCVWLLCDQRAHGGGFWSRKQSKPKQKIPSGKGRIRIRASSAINRAKFEGRVKGDNKFNKHKMAPLALDPKAKWRSNTSGQQRAAIAAQRKSERKLAALNARLLELRPACSEVRPLVAAGVCRAQSSHMAVATTGTAAADSHQGSRWQGDV